MSTFTKEQLIEHLRSRIEHRKGLIASIHIDRGYRGYLDYLKLELRSSEIALASLEAEPVAWLLSGGGAKNHVSFDSGNAYADPLREVTPLYTAPPAPVSVPDEATPENIEILASTFAPRGVTYQWDRDECNAAADSWNACHAAMLQGADQPQIAQQNIPEIIPATQFKPVADLYGLTSPTGDETSFTFDAVEARDFIDGGWSCQEYVELERSQEAITNHTEDKLAMVDHYGDSNNMVEPVTTTNKLPEGWVAVPVEPTEEMNKAGWTAMNEHDAINPTYRAMLAAAPQQEVDNE
ncbi:hypothetical protein [Enterobacter cloacae]|uniref:hypothetical protein n=1 Tax=Enterobacter cloacae TaxID=550 RepID=UPI0035C61137